MYCYISFVPTRTLNYIHFQQTQHFLHENFFHGYIPVYSIVNFHKKRWHKRKRTQLQAIRIYVTKQSRGKASHSENEP